MTTIAACIHDGIGAMAADRQISVAYTKTKAASPKIRQCAPWLIVGTSGASLVSMWFDQNPPPERPVSLPAAESALRVWMDGFRSWCKERGVDGASVMMLTPWGIVSGNHHGDADPLASPWWAIGSGAHFAIAALDLLSSDANDIRADASAKDIAWAAVFCAHRHDDSTGDPVDVLTIAMETA